MTSVMVALSGEALAVTVICPPTATEGAEASTVSFFTGCTTSTRYRTLTSGLVSLAMVRMPSPGAAPVTAFPFAVNTAGSLLLRVTLRLVASLGSAFAVICRFFFTGSSSTGSSFSSAFSRADRYGATFASAAEYSGSLSVLTVREVTGLTTVIFSCAR